MYQHHPTGRRAAAPASKIREYRPPGQLGQELTDRFKPPRHKLPRLAVYKDINCPQRIDGFFLLRLLQNWSAHLYTYSFRYLQKTAKNAVCGICINIVYSWRNIYSNIEVKDMTIGYKCLWLKDM